MPKPHAVSGTVPPLLSLLLLPLLPQAFLLCSLCSAEINVDPNPSIYSAVQENNVSYRLPLTVIPYRYNVTVEPYLYADPPSFKGSTSVETVAAVSTSNITLHARNLTLDRGNLKVLGPDDHEIEQEEPMWDDETQFYIINLKTKIVPGLRYIIVATNYTGLVQLDNTGFYLAKYKDKNGTEYRLATSQFQSIEARKVYPCFDEPAFKAVYNIELRHLSNYTSISNEALAKAETLGDSIVNDIYLASPPTTSYAVAMVVSNFKNVSTENYRIFARPEAIDSGLADYACSTTSQIVTTLEDYLQMEFPLPKLDQIAIPDPYFAPGAMENWGLITYRESYLLYSNETYSTKELQKTVTVMSHEISHQWFGDLVTLEYWNFLWLNEGFATFFEHFATSMVKPDWRMMDQFAIAVTQFALNRDYSNDTEPINFASIPPGHGPPGWVAYQKGAALLRMMYSFLSPEIFQKGLNIYLNRRKYTTARSGHLYRALQDAVDDSGANHLIGNFTISQIMANWEMLEGYPLVSVSRNNTDNTVVLKQKAFPYQTVPGQEYVWHIPVNFACSGNTAVINTSADVWLTTEETSNANPCGQDTWFIVNKLQTGFYRVNYEEENWRGIISFLNEGEFTGIDVTNRAQLIDDVFNLARWERISYDIALDLSLYLSKEIDYIPWFAYLTAIDFLNYNLATSDVYGLFMEYVFGVAELVLDRLGMQENATDTHTDKLNRNNLLRFLCYAGHNICLERSRSEFLRWQAEDIPQIAVDLQDAFFCGAMRTSSHPEWEFLLDRYVSSSEYNYSYRLRLLAGLACTDNRTTLSSYLDEIVNTSGSIEESQRTTAYQYVYTSGQIGLSLAFHYLLDNFENVSKAIDAQAIINGIASRLTTDDQLLQLKEFASNANKGDYFDKAIVVATHNVQWVKDNVDEIGNWLLSNKNQYYVVIA